MVRIPDGVSDVVAAPIMCAGATIYRGVSDARPPDQMFLLM